MKKLAMVLSLLVTVSATSVFGWGIGGTFGLGGNTLGGGLSLDLDSRASDLPLFGIEASGTEQNFRLGFTADWWVINQRLVDFLNFYVGPGLYVKLNITGNNDGSSVDAGLRVPLGINAYLFNNTFEGFLEWAPSFGVGFNAFDFPRFGFLNFAAGFRFWFN